MKTKSSIKEEYDILHRKNFIRRVKEFGNDERKVFKYKLTAPWHTIALYFLRDMDLNGKRVLEIGCGYGSLSVYMSKKGANVTGIDISSEAIKISKRNAKLNNQNIIFKQSTGERLQFNDENFDLVVSCEVLEHIPKYNKAVDEIIRVTKQNGKIMITTPNSLSFKGLFLYFQSRQPIENFFNYWTMLNEFRNRGIKILNIKTKSFVKDYDKKNFFDEFINKTILKYFSLRVGFIAKKQIK